MPREDNSLTIKIPLPKFLHGNSSAKHSQPSSPTHRKFTFASIGAVFLFLFFAFTLFNRGNRLVHFDFDTTIRIQEHVPLRLDPFLSFLSFLGNAEGVTVILILLLVLFRRKVGAIIALGLFGLAHVVEIIGKDMLNHPGPPKFMLRSQASAFPQFYVYTTGSYPSGHSLRMLFLAIIIAFIIYTSHKLSRNVKLILFLTLSCYAGLMLLSRISLGEHWTSDVIAGSLLGTSFGFFALIFL